MAALLFEAIEIITDTGLGVPVSYVNTGIGLMSDGHFAWMTGRYTVTTATGDSTRTDWVKNILTLDSGNWTLSRNADFVEAGAFESVSDFTVGIKNTADIRATLQANGVYLGRRRVKYYRATSSDGVTWAFELRCTGVVDDQPFNELRQSLKCVSTSKDIFGTIPTVPANNVTFPLMPKDSQDKMIPIALGRVAYSPTVNVRAAGQKQTLAIIGGVSYTFAACTFLDGTKKIVHIKTNGIAFVANDSALVSKYLNQIDGSQTPPPFRIVSNLATNTSDPSNPYTEITVDTQIPGTPVYWTLANNTDKPWFFEVLDLSATLIASSRPVYEVLKNGSSRPALSIYSTDQSRFTDISDASFKSSPTSIDSTGYPGYSCHAKPADATGDVEFSTIIVPKTVTMYGAPGGTNTFPAAGALAPLLNDRNGSTGYTMHMAIGSPPTFDQFTVDLALSESDAGGNYEALYVLPNFSAAAEVLSALVSVNAIVSLLDIYGRPLATGINHNFPLPTFDTTGTTFNLLPQFYFGNSDDPTLDALYNQGYGGPMDIVSLVSDSKLANIYQRIRVEFFFNNVNGDAFRFTLNEIGLVAVKKANFSTETVYGSNRGEVYGNTMDGRVSATDYPGSVVRVLEYLIRNYDEKALPWLPSHAYVAGDFVRGTADTGHVFVCTAAGTSSGTEPTWTDTAGATYTDGGVTWKEHHEIPIDTASFDSAAGERGFWLVGRTLTEKKDSLEYYQQLLAQSFLLGVTKPDGKVQLKAWLQDTTPIVAFSEANILPGTLGDVVETPVRRLYNDLLIQYDKNPASGKFNKQIAVTNIDKPAFPSSIEPVDAGTDLGAFTITAAAVGDGTYILTINTTAAHGMKGGDYLELSGNADGYNFALTACISAADSGVVNYITVHVDTGVFTSSLSSSGTLRKHATGRFKWQDYVAGIVNYSTAKDLWQQCHNSYLVTRVVNKMPDQLGQCEWYFDIYAQDANGKYIFSNDGGLTPEYDLGDLHAAVGFANALANWTAWKKKQPVFEVADTATFSALGLGDCVSFSDAKLTAGSPLIGWIHEKTQLPRDDSRKQMERFRFGLTLYPEPLNTYVPPGIIEEHGATDIIDEHGATDIIEEHGA